MNEAQRAYYEKLSKFKKVPPKDKASPVVHTGGKVRWRWKCAGCGAACVGEPIYQDGNRWYCVCARDA